jgi:hypothetical protein
MRIYNAEALRKVVRPVRTFPYAGIHVLSYLDGGVSGRDAVMISKKFTYDTTGYLIGQTEYINGVLWAKAASIIENGNISSYAINYFFLDTVTMINPQDLSEVIKIQKPNDRLSRLSYDIDKQNSLSMTGIFGCGSTNLVTRSVDYSLSGSGSDSIVSTYSYTFDDKNRVSRLIKTTKDKRDTCLFSYYK